MRVSELDDIERRVLMGQPDTPPQPTEPACDPPTEAEQHAQGLEDGRYFQRLADADLVRAMGHSAGAYEDFIARNKLTGDHRLKAAFRELCESIADAIEAYRP